MRRGLPKHHLEFSQPAWGWMLLPSGPPPVRSHSGHSASGVQRIRPVHPFCSSWLRVCLGTKRTPVSGILPRVPCLYCLNTLGNWEVTRDHSPPFADGQTKIPSAGPCNEAGMDERKAKQGKFEIMNMDMKLGTTLKIKGKIADDADGFVINLGQGTDTLDLHFNPRFGESTIVCNSRDGNNWGQEQREDHMCFSPGSEVKFTMTFESDKFKVKLPDGHQLTFPNRLGHSHLSYLSVVGGFSLSSFKLD